jgi:hypothetical protein
LDRVLGALRKIRVNRGVVYLTAGVAVGALAVWTYRHCAGRGPSSKAKAILDVDRDVLSEDLVFTPLVLPHQVEELPVKGLRTDPARVDETVSVAVAKLVRCLGLEAKTEEVKIFPPRMLSGLVLAVEAGRPLPGGNPQTAEPAGEVSAEVAGKPSAAKGSAKRGLVECAAADVPERSDVVVAASGPEPPYKIATAALEVRGHRMVREKDRPAYIRKELDACKGKFGTPRDTEANFKAVWHFAHGRMKDHGVRPSHISAMLPYVVHLTFVESEDELSAGVVKSAYKHMIAGRFDEHLSRMARWTRKMCRSLGWEFGEA